MSGFPPHQGVTAEPREGIFDPPSFPVILKVLDVQVLDPILSLPL